MSEVVICYESYRGRYSCGPHAEQTLLHILYYNNNIGVATGYIIARSRPTVVGTEINVNRPAVATFHSRVSSLLTPALLRYVPED